VDIGGYDSFLGVPKRLPVHGKRSHIGIHADNCACRNYRLGPIDFTCLKVEAVEVRHQVVAVRIGAKWNPAALAVEHLRQQ